MPLFISKKKKAPPEDISHLWARGGNTPGALEMLSIPGWLSRLSREKMWSQRAGGGG